MKVDGSDFDLLELETQLRAALDERVKSHATPPRNAALSGPRKPSTSQGPKRAQFALVASLIAAIGGTAVVSGLGGLRSARSRSNEVVESVATRELRSELSTLLLPEHYPLGREFLALDENVSMPAWLGRWGRDDEIVEIGVGGVQTLAPHLGSINFQFPRSRPLPFPPPTLENFVADGEIVWRMISDDQSGLISRSFRLEDDVVFLRLPAGTPWAEQVRIARSVSLLRDERGSVKDVVFTSSPLGLPMIGEMRGVDLITKGAWSIRDVKNRFRLLALPRSAFEASPRNFELLLPTTRTALREALSIRGAMATRVTLEGGGMRIAWAENETLFFVSAIGVSNDEVLAILESLRPATADEVHELSLPTTAAVARSIAEEVVSEGSIGGVDWTLSISRATTKDGCVVIRVRDAKSSEELATRCVDLPNPSASAPAISHVQSVRLGASRAILVVTEEAADQIVVIGDTSRGHVDVMARMTDGIAVATGKSAGSLESYRWVAAALVPAFETSSEVFAFSRPENETEDTEAVDDLTRLVEIDRRRIP